MKPVFKAIILAAGEGKRMHPLTANTPKPLLRVGGKTFIDYIFDALPDGVSEVIMVIGYKREQIKEYMGDNYRGRRIFYVVQENPTGTAHAFLLSRPYFKEPQERFLIFYGDEIPTPEQIAECVGYEFSWLCHYMDDPRHSGVAEIDGDGRIVAIIEKPEIPKSNLVVGGAMVINTDIFNYSPVAQSNGEYYLADMMNEFLKNHYVKAVMGIPNLGFTSPEDINKFEQDLLDFFR